MANYSIATTSKFHPFSYQELLAPALLATQAHQAIEEAYGDLNLQSSIWEGLTEGSPKAREQYRKFAEDLAKEAETLSKYGLSPSSRQAMLNMRGRFGKEITPIEQAYKRREAQAAAQQQALLNNPTLLFNRKAASTSLDDYLANPELDYNVYSGALLEKQVSDAATALAKAARNDPNVQKTLMRKLLPYQYETIRQSGFDPETVRATIMGTQGGSEILAGIVNDTLAASGIGNWNFATPADKEQVLKEARAWANRGLWSSVGETKYGNLTDSFNMQWALNEQAHRNAVKLAKEKETPPPAPNLPYRPIANTKVLADTEQLKKDLEFLKGLSETGMSKFSKKKVNSENGPITRTYMGRITGNYANSSQQASEYEIAKSKYKNIAKRYGINVNQWGPNVNQSLIDRVTKEIQRNVVRSQIYQLNQTDQSLVAKVLGENSSTLSISNRKRSGLKDIDEYGRVGDELDANEAAQIFKHGSDFHFSYDPSAGFQLGYTMDENGKSEFKTVQIDPDLINLGSTKYTRAHNWVQQYLNKDDYGNAENLIDSMMTELYYMFNTLSVKQENSGTVK